MVLQQEHLTTRLLSRTDRVAEAEKESADDFTSIQSVQICRQVEPPGFRKNKTPPKKHTHKKKQTKNYDFNTFWLLNGSVKPSDRSTS